MSLEGWRVQRARYPAAFDALLREYERRARWSRDRVEALRVERLRAFLSHAGATVPHYRRIFRELGFDPARVRSFDDLAVLPVLSKQVVREATERFASTSVPSADCLTAHTSGTTGAGLRFSVTHTAHREQWAVWWRFRRAHGIERTTPCLYFGGRSVVPLKQTCPPFWRHNRPGRQLLFSAYHLGEHTARDYLEAMSCSRAPWIHGYPSQLAALAAHAISLGARLPAIRWVTTGAESLLPHQATLIEQAFGVAPIEHYGMAEGVANFSMCPRRRLHVDEDFSAVEFVPVEGGWSIVGTNFTNLATPLVRYEVGDMACLPVDDPDCACGWPGRVVASVDGRREDFVMTRRGARLGRLDHVFKDQVRIREAQIRQERIGHMIVLLVKGAGYEDRDERSLRDELRKRVGDEVDFEIRYTDRIERTSSGKVRFVVSTLPEGALEPPRSTSR